MQKSDAKLLEYEAPVRKQVSERQAWRGLIITLIVCLVAVLLSPLWAWLFWLLGQWR